MIIFHKKGDKYFLNDIEIDINKYGLFKDVVKNEIEITDFELPYNYNEKVINYDMNNILFENFDFLLELLQFIEYTQYDCDKLLIFKRLSLFLIYRCHDQTKLNISHDNMKNILKFIPTIKEKEYICEKYILMDDKHYILTDDDELEMKIYDNDNIENLDIYDFRDELEINKIDNDIKLNNFKLQQKQAYEGIEKMDIENKKYNNIFSNNEYNYIIKNVIPYNDDDKYTFINDQENNNLTQIIIDELHYIDKNRVYLHKNIKYGMILNDFIKNYYSLKNAIKCRIESEKQQKEKNINISNIIQKIKDDEYDRNK